MSLSSVAQSGLQAATTALEVSANNVANARTDGFVPSVARPEALEGGGVEVSISEAARAAQADGSSGTDLVQEATNQIAAVAVYRANLKSLQAADETNAALMNVLK